MDKFTGFLLCLVLIGAVVMSLVIIDSLQTKALLRKVTDYNVQNSNDLYKARQEIQWYKEMFDLMRSGQFDKVNEAIHPPKQQTI